MPVKLNSSAGGSVTLDVPATATDTTLTLPVTGGSLAGAGSITTSGLTQNTSRLLGRTTASSGAVEEITVGAGLSLSGGTLAASGGGQLREQLFTAGGSWTAPAGVTRVQAIVIGAGGGGGGPNTTGCGNDGGPGGIGGVAVGNVTVTPGTSYTITIGAGGTGGGTNANGTSGGTSSFGALMSATGGSGGLANGGSGSPGSGSGGTTRNTNASIFVSLQFNGTLARSAGSGSAGVAWSITTANTAGAQGGGGILSVSAAAGGVGGIIYLQWVG